MFIVSVLLSLCASPATAVLVPLAHIDASIEGGASMIADKACFSLAYSGLMGTIFYEDTFLFEHILVGMSDVGSMFVASSSSDPDFTRFVGDSGKIGNGRSHAQRNVVLCRELKLHEVLKDPADGATDIGNQIVPKIFTINLNTTTRWIMESAEELYQRRLPYPIGPDECDMFPWPDRKGEVPDRHTFFMWILE